jgi:hypothetical protein
VLEQFEPAPALARPIHVARGQMAVKTRLFLDFATPRLLRLLLR